MDATLIHLDSEGKQHAAATFKGVWGVRTDAVLHRTGWGLRPGCCGRVHPGASLRLCDHNGLRHQVTLTNDPDRDPVAIERLHRAHAQVENRIKNLKDTGLSRLPFSDYNANQTWVELVLLADLLLTAVQILVDDDELAVAGPRRLRYTLLHVAARIPNHVHQIRLKLDRTWPWTHVLVAIHRRLDATPVPAVY